MEMEGLFVNTRVPYHCFKSIPTSSTRAEDTIDGDSFDASSRKGKFGWTTVGSIHLPFLLRGNEKYVAVRMVGKRLLDQYVLNLSSHVYAYNRIKAYFITESEAILLNEINFKHLGEACGMKKFTKSDVITSLKDTIKFYNFVHFCYTKVTNVVTQLKSNCGFIEIGKQIVPYITINDNKFVPTLFFQSIAERMKNKCLLVDSWDWAYLRFYCNIIGVGHEAFPLSNCPVINIADIKEFYPDTEEFKIYLPAVIKDSCYFVKKQKTVNIPWFVISQDSFFKQ